MAISTKCICGGDNCYGRGINPDGPYQHNSHYGSKFAGKCNLSGTITVERPSHLTDEQFACDVSEFIGYHLLNIRPCLNGFAGYGAVLSYKITIED